jgi:uncharacterized protein with PhoU and TrkA domain
LVRQSSLITARRVLKHLISPQVQVFIEYLRERGEDICEQAVTRLNSMIGDNPPHLWQVVIDDENASAVMEFIQKGNDLTLGELVRNPHDLESSLSCMPLSVVRGEDRIMLPRETELLVPGDQLLFCGTAFGETMLAASMNNAYTLDYLICRREKARGYIFQWFEDRRKKAAPQV